jgi:hypothetical protein
MSGLWRHHFARSCLQLAASSPSVVVNFASCAGVLRFFGRSGQTHRRSHSAWGYGADICPASSASHVSALSAAGCAKPAVENPAAFSHRRKNAQSASRSNQIAGAARWADLASRRRWPAVVSAGLGWPGDWLGRAPTTSTKQQRENGRFYGAVPTSSSAVPGALTSWRAAAAVVGKFVELRPRSKNDDSVENSAY